ncbi:MAG TPA: BatD family protein [Opitutaceae bacterium]|nr:BatD family protein [Opitutaceae bacterium]
MRLRSALFLVFAFVLVLPAARAQTVQWDPPRGSLPVGQARALALVFEGCSPKGQPVPPKVDGLTLQFHGQSSNTSIINRTFSHSTTLTFAAQLTKNQRVEIPSFEIETDKGRVRVPAARYEPTGATIGNSGTPLDSAATAKLTPTPASLWAGEVFDLVTVVEAARSYVPQFQRSFDWSPDPLLAESWSSPEQTDFNVGAEPHIGIMFRTRAMARAPGSVTLNPATHLVNLSVGVSGFGFFQQRQYDQYSVASNTPTLEVNPLPPQPAGFGGAVGQFKFESKVVPATAAVGEPITWTLELSGTGNWPAIPGLPSRDVSKDFNVVQPQAKRTPAEGKIFDVTLSEDVVLVPTKAGSYTLGPVSFVYFDPKSGSYKTITAPRMTVTVTAPSVSKFTFTPPATDPADTTGQPAEKSGPAGAVLSSTPPPVATSPSSIPRDPLTGTYRAIPTREMRTVLVIAACPFGALLLLWTGLAMRRAHQTDPVLPRRLARIRLAATLVKLRDAGPAQRSALILAWQRDTAALWEIPHAVPAPSAFNDPTWSTLWRDSDRALYGAEAALPSEWVKRAENALAAKRVSGFAPVRLFLPRNLAPFLFALVVAIVVFPATLGAQDPAAAYRAGSFAAAENSWRDVLAGNPLDAVARHNLSLALAQQDRWTEAAAHSAIAFIHHPNDPAVRWQFALSSEKAGAVPEPLAAFLQPTPARKLAAYASPAVWQRAILAAACGVALALAWILFNSYGRRSRAMLWSGLVLLGLSAAFGGVSVFAVAAYGRAADTRAVITLRGGTLRSIPTEADTAQKTTSLSAATLAVADRDFLGWTRLVFENGQTGWVRKEELVWIWK